jgi:hypothetical protein
MIAGRVATPEEMRRAPNERHAIHPPCNTRPMAIRTSPTQQPPAEPADESCDSDAELGTEPPCKTRRMAIRTSPTQQPPADPQGDFYDSDTDFEYEHNTGANYLARPPSKWLQYKPRNPYFLQSFSSSECDDADCSQGSQEDPEPPHTTRDEPQAPNSAIQPTLHRQLQPDDPTP